MSMGELPGKSFVGIMLVGRLAVSHGSWTPSVKCPHDFK